MTASGGYLDVRPLHARICRQLAREWERLAEMKRVQIEVLEEIASAAVAADGSVARD